MKMVFCDIDGTLYRDNKQISPLNKEALMEIVKTLFVMGKIDTEFVEYFK